MNLVESMIFAERFIEALPFHTMYQRAGRDAAEEAAIAVAKFREVEVDHKNISLILQEARGNQHG